MTVTAICLLNCLREMWLGISIMTFSACFLAFFIRLKIASQIILSLTEAFTSSIDLPLNNFPPIIKSGFFLGITPFCINLSLSANCSAVSESILGNRYTFLCSLAERTAAMRSFSFSSFGSEHTVRKFILSLQRTKRD